MDIKDYFIFVCYLSVVISSELFPTNLLKRCKKNDVELNYCIINRIYEIKPKLSKGIPELGIIRLEPIKVPQVELKIDSITIILTYPQIYGVSDFKMNDFNLDINESKLKFDILFSNVTFESRYKINGEFYNLTVDSDGVLEVNFTNLNILLEMSGYHEIKNDKDYLKFNDTKTGVNIKLLSLHVEDLFKENANIIEMINDNIQLLKRHVGPYLENTFGLILQHIGFKVFEIFSIDELFSN